MKSKTQSKISLVLRIHNSGKVDQKVVNEKNGFSIGQRHDNDLILIGKNFPKKHTLVSKRNGYYQLFLPSYVNDGELREGDATLNLRDLMIHDILPREKNGYVIKLSPKKQGYLAFGDTRIEFLFDYKKVVRPVLPKFSGFSWVNASAKNIFSDLTFKLIFLLLFSLNLTILYLFKDYEIKIIEEKIDIEKVQQRFAKFILKTQEEIESLTADAISSALTDDEKDSEADAGKKDKEQRTSKKGKAGEKQARGNPVASAGLLGLIGGTGSTGKSSSVVDALVDRGLVADLKSVLGGGTNLKVGRNNTKDGIDPLDQLIGTGGSGGIDDFLESLDEGVETVTLRKQVRVNLAQAESKSGDAEALGARSEQSVMNVVNARMGRITYLYEKYLKRQPNLQGKITVQFTIAANGFVTSVKVMESTIDQPQLVDEIVNLVRRLKFDPIPQGSAIFVFPFHFKKIQ